ncbi:Uncharacterised protein [Providencia rettgeri]|nr:Uncharacterised protein [Providencia rettgeri]
MIFPKLGEVYQSKKTKRCFYSLGYKRNHHKYAQSQYDACLLCTERHIYSEVPLSWFNSIYVKVKEAEPLPELEVIFYYHKRLLLDDSYSEADYSFYF